MKTQDSTTSAPPTPMRCVRLGTVSKKQVRKLKQGHGKLMVEVQQIVDTEMAKLPPADDGKTYQPIVFIFRKKLSKKARKKRNRVKVGGATVDREKLSDTLERSGISF